MVWRKVSSSMGWEPDRSRNGVGRTSMDRQQKRDSHPPPLVGGHLGGRFPASVRAGEAPVESCRDGRGRHQPPRHRQRSSHSPRFPVSMLNFMYLSSSDDLHHKVGRCCGFGALVLPMAAEPSKGERSCRRHDSCFLFSCFLDSPQLPATLDVGSWKRPTSRFLQGFNHSRAQLWTSAGRDILGPALAMLC
jgi:hypothetical protein